MLNLCLLEEDKKITELSRDFTLQNYDALIDLLKKKTPLPDQHLRASAMD
ncbi:MAG: hypothetical protein U0T81_11825 [Saprospiraceae bacterium]